MTTLGPGAKDESDEEVVDHPLAQLVTEDEDEDEDTEEDS